MAKAVILNKLNGKVSSLKNSDFYLSKVTYLAYTSVLKTLGNKTSKIETSNYPVSTISYLKINPSVKSVLPFRVKITNIMVEGYGPNNPAPIGIAIIGVNNYIL